MNDALLAERRDHITEQLASEYARGAFDVEELERRLALVHAATSPAELDALGGNVALVPAQRVRVVMGSLQRIGPWTVPQELAVRVVLGNAVLDLRDARLSPGVTTIAVDVTMGNVEVIAPFGVRVEVDASAWLGNIDERTEPWVTTSAPTVRVIGRVKLGNLELVTLHAGETRRDAGRWRRRRRRELISCRSPWE
jgi:hypothetical protein